MKVSKIMNRKILCKEKEGLQRNQRLISKEKEGSKRTMPLIFYFSFLLFFFICVKFSLQKLFFK